MVTEKPTDAVSAFENLSIATKGARVALPEPPSDAADASGPVLEWATASSALFVKPDEDPAGVPGPDLLSDAALYEWAGVSFGRTETYRLYLSLKKFAESLDGGYEALKFWGKVSARSGDYYVAYGKTPEDPEEVDATKVEGKAGANKYTYFVSKGSAASWTALPNVTSEQIVIASQIRRLLTGDLTAAVPSYPPFPGNEASLLRATICRITASTAIAPAGFFEANEDGGVEPVKNDDGEVDAPRKECAELLEGAGWAHMELRLNTLGRCTKLPENENEDAEPVEGDEVVDPLGGVAEEEGVDQWSFRAAPGGAGTVAASMAKATSMDWPGAYAVAGGKTFVNVYVGNGLPYGATPYSPPMPGDICGEWAVPEEEVSEEVVAGVFPVEGKDVVADPTPPAEEGEEE